MSKAKLLFLFSAMAFYANATHIIGGYMSYRYISGLQYQMILTVYRDCTSGTDFDGTPSSTTPSAAVGLFEINPNGTYTLVNNYSLVNPTITSLTNTSPNPCLVVPPNVCVEQGRYIYTFNVPDNTKSYILVYERCCRNNSITNLNNPGSLGAVYSAIIPPTATYGNSNPTFNNFPPIFICQGSPLVFDHSATDLNGDSLVYGLCEPQNGADQNNPAPNPPNSPPYPTMSWAASYSANDPLGGVPLTIDPTTGLLTGTPNNTGQYVVGICVSEYRNGVLIGTYLRDFQFNVSRCNIPDANIPFQPGTFDPIKGLGVYENICSSKSIDFSRGTTFSPAPGTSAPLSYAWDFGVPGITTDTSSQRLPSYVYPDTGTYIVKVVVSQTVNGAGCADTAKAIVKIYPTLKANFTFSPTACQDSSVLFRDSTISTASPLATWSWNFGDGTSSSLQNPVKKYNAAGTFRVKLTVTNRVGCVDTISKLITVNPQPIADFTYNTPCENEVVNFSYTGSANVTNYNWTLAAGQTSTLQDPSYTYNSGGTKTVSLITITNQGCRDTATKSINILPKPTVSITPNTTICAGTSIQLIAAGGAQYSWRNDSTLSSTTVANPTATPLQNTTYVVTVTGTNGCFRKDSVRISLQTPPPVDAGKDTSVCFNIGSFRDSVKLQASGAISYRWTPTTGVSNPNIANPTVRPLVNTTYFVTGTDANGCFATDSVIVYFLDPSLNLIVENVQPICIRDTISLTILEQGAGSYGWSPPTGLSNATSNTPRFFPSATTTYIFTVQNYCYLKRDTVTVKVNPLPLVTTQKLDSVCIGDSVMLRANGANVYAWNASPTISDTSIANPFALPNTTTTYTVLGTDTNGCKNKDSVRVFVFFPPLTDVLPDTAFICQGDPVTLQAIGGVRYLWNADPSLSSTTISNPIATPLDTTTYFVKITNIHNCSTNDTITINVQHPVTAVTQSPYDFCTGKAVQLNASGGFYYQWTPPISLSNPNVANPFASPSSSVVYVVNVSNDCFSDTATVVLTIRPLPIIDAGMDTLIYRNTEATLQGVSNVSNNYWAPGLHVKNPLDLNSTANPLKTSRYYLYAISNYGCMSIDSVLITVDPKTQLFIPTAFSPNNDGENDVFRIVPPTLNIAQLDEFAVFNRWGEKVFSTHDINEGWNGSFNNRPQDVGVYIWYVRAVTYDGEPVFKKGNVTLVK